MAPATKKKPETEDRNWYKDRYQTLAVQRKLLAFFTLASLIITLITVVVIAQLTPLKTVEPFVIQVDQKTGITQVVDPIKAKELTTNEAVNNFFIVQYIRAREGYEANNVRYNYDGVRIMSAGKLYENFIAQVDPNNPLSPIAQLGTSGARSIRFKSISYINPNLAQARIVVEEKLEQGNLTQKHKIILIGFDYVQIPLSMEERFINPLGFQVTDYRIDEDVMTQ